MSKVSKNKIILSENKVSESNSHSKKMNELKDEIMNNLEVSESNIKKDINLEMDINDENYLNRYKSSFETISKKMIEIKNLISDISSEHKQLQKNIQKDLKCIEKKKNKVAFKKNKREPSGFAKPTKLSEDLCDFIGKPYGTEMARTEVTKFLTCYIKENNLQKEEDKRKIKPDQKLLKLLGVDDKEEVTYFNLQKWMKPHFTKNEMDNTAVCKELNS
jgi:upstream activation factor subunit UAF30